MQLEVNTEELRKQKIFVAAPMYGGMCHGIFARSMMDLASVCKEIGIPLQVYYLFNESLITRARNYCADEFLRSDATHLMFIDSDIGFDPKDIIALLGMSIAHENKDKFDVIGGPYPKKCISWEKVVMAVNKGFGDPRSPNQEYRSPEVLERFVGDYVFNPKGASEIRIDEPAEVLEIGTGFMMARRATFELLNEAFPERLYRPDHVRNPHFDGSREIMMYFQADVDRAYIFRKSMDKMRRIDWKDNPEAALEAIKIIEDSYKFFESGSKRYLSEDYLFCQDVQTAGMHVWLCPWMKTQHAGSYIFGGSLADLAMVGAAATADLTQMGKAPAQTHKREDKAALINRLRESVKAKKVDKVSP